jgi:hypothetical protein
VQEPDSPDVPLLLQKPGLEPFVVDCAGGIGDGALV